MRRKEVMFYLRKLMEHEMRKAKNGRGDAETMIEALEAAHDDVERARWNERAVNDANAVMVRLIDAE